MLEEILKEMNTNLKRIADAMEKEVAAPKATTKRKSKKDTEEAKEVVETAIEPQIIVEAGSDANIAVASESITKNIVPVNTAQENYTQEEIARAMSGAMDMGRSDIVFGILQAFGTNSLMGIDPSKYGDVARMLREAGVKI